MPVNSNAPGPPPRTGSWVVGNGKTWETVEKKEKGRQGCDTTDMRAGSRTPWLDSWLLHIYWDNSVILRRIIELEKNLLIMYLI